MPDCSLDVEHSVPPTRDTFGPETNFTQALVANAKLIGWLRVYPREALSASRLSGAPMPGGSERSLRRIVCFADIPTVGVPVKVHLWTGNDTLGGFTPGMTIIPTVVEANNADIRERERRDAVVDWRDQYANYHVEGYRA